MAECTSDIRQLAGEDNVVADSLSRPPGAVHMHEPADAHCVKVTSMSQCCSHGTCGTAGASPVVAVVPSLHVVPVDSPRLAVEQDRWVGMGSLMANSSLHVLQVDVAGSCVWCDSYTGVLRPIIPPGQCEKIFHSEHSLAPVE